MPISGQFIQLLGTLSDIQARRQQMELASQAQDLQERKFSEDLKTTHDKDIADALNTLVKLQPSASDAFLTLGKKFSPEEISALRATVAGLPPDVAAMAARFTSSGVQSMNPQQQTQLGQEVASRNLSGQTMGGMAQSGLQGAVAGMIQQNPQMLGGMAQMTATQQTPFQAAGEQGLMQRPGAATQAASYRNALQMTPEQVAANIVGQGQVQAQFQQSNVMAMHDAAEAATQMMMARAKGQLTPEAIMNAVGTDMPKIMAAILDPKTDAGAAAAYLASYNSLAAMIGRPDMYIMDKNDPQAPQKLSGLMRLYQSTFGGQSVPMQPGQAGPPQMAPGGMPPASFNPFAVQAPGSPMGWYSGPHP